MAHLVAQVPGAGTLACHIIDGASEVRIFGEDIRVRARIYTINGFSAHADRDELLAWHALIGNPERTFLVHGEEQSMSEFAARLQHMEVVMSNLKQVYEL